MNQVRWMLKRDVDEVLRIEALATRDPLSRKDLMDHLRQRNCIGMVVDNGHEAVGYMVYLLHKSSLVLIRLAVHPDWQRSGVATQMIDRLKLKLHHHRRREIFINVPDYELGMQLFLRAQNFRAVGVARGEVDEYRFRYVKPVKERVEA